MSSPSPSSQAGSHRGGSSSLSAMVSTLVPSAVVAGLLFGAFLILRAKQKRLYAPRTYHDKLLEGYITYGPLTDFANINLQ
jgi:hypothetical protein